MCTGLEIAGIAAAVGGAGLSAAGQARTMREQNANARREVEARNARLRETLTKNDALADQSRDLFEKRMLKTTGTNFMEENRRAGLERLQGLNAAVDTVAPATEGAPSLAGSTPEVVRGEVATRLRGALESSRQRAQALGKLGGYTDALADRGIEDAAMSRELGVLSNFGAGNLSGLGTRQDLTAAYSQKPISPIGGVMQGLGGALGAYAGAGLPGIGTAGTRIGAVLGLNQPSAAAKAAMAAGGGGLY